MTPPHGAQRPAGSVSARDDVDDDSAGHGLTSPWARTQSTKPSTATQGATARPATAPAMRRAVSAPRPNQTAPARAPATAAAGAARSGRRSRTKRGVRSASGTPQARATSTPGGGTIQPTAAIAVTPRTKARPARPENVPATRQVLAPPPFRAAE